MKPTSELTVISVAMAKKWLESNHDNRSISIINLKGVTQSMRRNDWAITGESVKFTKSGKLIDGQHRLQGIINSGKPQEIFVTKGLEENVFKYLDTGRKRTASDVLGIEGFPNSKKIAAIARFIINFEAGQYGYAAHNKVSSKIRISNADISKFVTRHKSKVYDSLEYGFNKQNNVVSGVLLSAMHYVLNKINSVQADDFCWKLASGENLTKESPIYVLRTLLFENIRSRRKIGALEKIALISKAWNAYRKNQIVKVLRWDFPKESFPKPL